MRDNKPRASKYNPIVHKKTVKTFIEAQYIGPLCNNHGHVLEMQADWAKVTCKRCIQLNK